jgi:hypothetical protein
MCTKVLILIANALFIQVARVYHNNLCLIYQYLTQIYLFESQFHPQHYLRLFELALKYKRIY